MGLGLREGSGGQGLVEREVGSPWITRDPVWPARRTFQPVEKGLGGGPRRRWETVHRTTDGKSRNTVLQLQPMGKLPVERPSAG